MLCPFYVCGRGSNMYKPIHPARACKPVRVVYEGLQYIEP